MLVKLKESIVLLKNPDELKGKKSITFNMVFDCVTSISEKDRVLDYRDLIIKNNLVEIVEIPTHPWFIGVQFHPEFKSTVANPHPLFIGFINACIQNKKQTDETK